MESGRELSTVAAVHYAAEAGSFPHGTGIMTLTTHLPITHRHNVRELTSGACDAIFR